MAAKTENQNITIKEGNIVAYPIATSAHVYKGVLAVVDQDGYLQNYTSAFQGEARIPVIPIEELDYSTSAAGSIDSSGNGTGVVKCYTTGMFQGFAFSSISQNDVGKTIFASNNFTLDEAQSDALRVGTLEQYLSTTTGVWSLNKFYNADGTICVKGAVTATSGNGGLFAWLNPHLENIMIEDVILDVTTVVSAGGAGSATSADIGIGATATTSADDIYDGILLQTVRAYGAASGVGGTNGKNCPKKATSGQYVTGSAQGIVTSLVATYMIKYRLWE